MKTTTDTTWMSAYTIALKPIHSLRAQTFSILIIDLNQRAHNIMYLYNLYHPPADMIVIILFDSIITLFLSSMCAS